MPVRRRVALDVAVSPVEALRCLRDDARPFALIGAWAGGGALLGSDPVRVAGTAADPFALLDDEPAASGDDAIVGGGWFGVLRYGLAHFADPAAPAQPPHRDALPAAPLAFHDHVLRLDEGGRWWLEMLWTPERDAALQAREADLRARLGDPPAPRGAELGDWAWTPSLAAHARAVSAAIERIRAGDLYQANLTLRLDGRLTSGTALDLFCAAHGALPTDRAAFVEGPWGALVSLSPELYLSRRGSTVRSAPIKGTRPRPADPALAAAARDELAASAKDRAENVMIVDLVRNDLGRVCTPGSVRVEALGEVRPHAGVWHMVSEVTGALRPGVGDGALLRATFPPGSVTGAPKLAAMSAIAELESTAREAYTGAIGFSAAGWGSEWSVVIRTLEVHGDRVWLGAGGGIVADSDPAAEANEAVGKVAPILAALGAPPAPHDDGNAPGPTVVRRAARPLPRPDAALGVFETIAVRDGASEHLAAHLVRLDASVRALYGARLPDDAAQRAQDAARALGGDGALRLRVRPAEQEHRIALEAHAAHWTAPAPWPAIEPVVIPGGLGAHKWLDRRMADALEAACSPALALVCDLDGAVLETTRANVAVLISGRLRTPPLDGRILPGVTRARLVDAAAGVVGVEQTPLTMQDVRAADAVIVTSALRVVTVGRVAPAAEATLAALRAALDRAGQPVSPRC